MRVLINAAYWPLSSTEDYDSLVAAAFESIITQFDQHHFIFVCTSQFVTDQLKKNNCTFHIVKRNGGSLLKYKYWFDISVPRLLKKYKADLFVSPFFCSLRISLPQVVWMPDLTKADDWGEHKKLQQLFYKKYIPAFLQKADRIITFSKTAKESIADKPEIPAEKVSSVTPVISSVYHSTDDQQKSDVKEKYCDGKEYFLFGGNATTSSKLLQLLKAFSLFKKRQQSGMKLLISIVNDFSDASFKKSIATYKYRNDVVLLENVAEAEYAQLVSSAYAFVYPVLQDGFGIRVLQAIRSHVPVITTDFALMKEIGGDAALYCKAGEPASIADQLMRLYKDERLRQTMAEKAALLSSEYDPLSAARQLWHYMEKAVSSPS